MSAANAFRSIGGESALEAVAQTSKPTTNSKEERVRFFRTGTSSRGRVDALQDWRRREGVNATLLAANSLPSAGSGSSQPTSTLQQVTAPSALASSSTSSARTYSPRLARRTAVRGNAAGITTVSPIRSTLAAYGSSGSTSTRSSSANGAVSIHEGC